MAYTTWTYDKGNTFSGPYIPDKIVGFHGIDPDLVGEGGSGGIGIDDHEQLQNLLGGNNRGHYHITDRQYQWLCMMFDDVIVLDGERPYSHQITSLYGFNALVDARIAEYMSQQNNGG